LRLLKERQPAGLAQLIIEKGTIFKAFPDLLTDDALTTRLGAMAALEILAERNRNLAKQVIPVLWERFKSLAETVRGDVIYMTGELGAIEKRPDLKSLLHQSESAEISEAAEEALEKLDSFSAADENKKATP
jgi:hypothetical protein